MVLLRVFERFFFQSFASRTKILKFVTEVITGNLLFVEKKNTLQERFKTTALKQYMRQVKLHINTSGKLRNKDTTNKKQLT